MPRHYQPNPFVEQWGIIKMKNTYNCNKCGVELGEMACSNQFGGSFCSAKCADEDQCNRERIINLETSNHIPLSDIGVSGIREYNKPEHYHKHNIDTILFLQEGFPKEVFMGFALGHIIKYAQRANYKNGREDYVKMVDYAKRALDWYDKTHSE